MIQCLIFDMDGTLADNTEFLCAVWKQALEDYGIKSAREQLLQIYGLMDDDAFRLLGLEPIEGFTAHWFKVQDSIPFENDYLPGVEEALKAFQKADYTLGLVTSRDQLELDEYFQKMNLKQWNFQTVTAEMTKLHKPDPEPFEYFMETYGWKPQECLYIGDLETDRAAANAAGIDCVLIKTELEQNHPEDLEFRSMTDFARWFLEKENASVS